MCVKIEVRTEHQSVCTSAWKIMMAAMIDPRVEAGWVVAGRD